MATMRQMKNGRWMVQWYDEHGVRHRKKKLPTKALAQQLYDQVCAARLLDMAGIVGLPAIRTGPKYISRGLTLRELATRYRDDYLATQTHAASNVLYVDMLIAKWGPHPVMSLTIEPFRAWIRYLLHTPIHTARCAAGETKLLRPNSVNKLVRYMVRILSWGVECGMIPSSPFRGRVRDRSLNREFARQPRFKPVVITQDEFTELTLDWPPWLSNVCQGAFWSGVRRSELEAWRWSRTDQKCGSVKFEADELKEADPKTVYYDRELAPLLSSLEVEYIAAGHNDDRVFRGLHGRRLTDDSLSNAVRYWADKAAKRTDNARYAKVTLHTFRRSYRTRKALEGHDARAVARNMGHHNLSTSAIYDIVEESRQREVAGWGLEIPEELQRRLEELLGASCKVGVSLADLQAALRRQAAEKAREARASKEPTKRVESEKGGITARSQERGS